MGEVLGSGVFNSDGMSTISKLYFTNNRCRGDVEVCRTVAFVFTAKPITFRFHRSITRPYFTRDRISHFELFDRKAEQVITKLKDRIAQGYAVDMQVRLNSNSTPLPSF